MMFRRSILIAFFATVAAGRATDFITNPVEIRKPAVTDEEAAAGRMVRQVAEEYRGTAVHHALYLPANWEPGKSFPVIVEYAPNRTEEFSGDVDDCRLGFALSGGRDFLWLVLPYVDPVKKINVTKWWGDAEATAEYCLTNLRRVCERYGGDPNAVILCGFSRGAIACGYVGLRDEKIADVWLGFYPHSHIDGGRFTVEGARERLARTRGRATFVTYGSEDSGKSESPKGARILREYGFPIIEREVPGVAHTDRFLDEDSPVRRELRTWLADVITHRPGTFAVRGRVLDDVGRGLAGARVQCGPWHWAKTDAEGRYEIRSLVPGRRRLTVVKEGARFSPEGLELEIRDRDVQASELQQF